MVATDLKDIQEGMPIFIHEIDDIYISGYTGFHLALRRVIGPGTYTPLYETDFIPPLSGKSWVPGLSDIIETYLIQVKSSEADFEIVTTDGQTRTARSFHAIRSSAGIEDAATLLPLMFLTDADMLSVPYETPEDVYEPTVSIYDKTAVNLYIMTDAGSIPVAPESVGNIHTYTIPMKQLLTQDPPEPGERRRWTAAAGNRSIVIQADPYTGGIGILFENTFGVMEYMYLKGVWTEAPEKSHTVAAIHGRRKSVAPVITPKYTLECSGLTYWQAEAASRLLQARHVEICRGCVPGAYGTNREMIIESVSGNIQDDPATLSDIKITMTPTKI